MVHGVRLLLLGSLLIALTFAPRARAQGYPDRPIKLIVTHAAGSAADVPARLLAAHMSNTLGQQVVVENIAGASGAIGVQTALKAEPNGYTLLGVGDSVLTSVAILNKNARFDPFKDLEPITQVNTIEWVLVVHPSLGVSTVQELIALAKAKPGELNFSSGGLASPQHMAMELFMAKTGISMKHVPYRGVTQAVNDLVAGVVPIIFTGTSLVVGMIEGGQVKVLGTTGAKRSTLLAKVPTLSEQGVAGYDWTTWLSFMAPKGTSAEIVQKINAAAIAALKDKDVSSKMLAAGLIPWGTSPEEFRKGLEADYAKMDAVIKSAGITLAQQ